MRQEPNGREARDELYWRSEILQVMYWMQGEGLATTVTPSSLADFLVANPDTVAHQMELLAVEGLLDIVERQQGMADEGDTPAQYRLSEEGQAEGGRSFADEFAELTRQGHGECAPGCSCHDPAHAGEPCPHHPERHFGI